MRKKLIFLGVLLSLFSACQAPFSRPLVPETAGRSLNLSWATVTPRTLAPVTYPTPVTYDVKLHPSSGAELSQVGLAATSWTFNNLAAVVYTITVTGRDGSGAVLVSGTGSADLTALAVQSPSIPLSYLTSGTGTGQIHLTFDATLAGVSVTSAALTLVDPTGAVSTPPLETGTNTFTFAAPSAPVGTYKLFARFSTGIQTARKIDSLFVVQGVDTAVTVLLTAKDFHSTYVPVTKLNLDRANLGLIAGGLTGTLVASLVPDSPSNSLVTWSSDTPGVATVDQTGVVTGVAFGTAVIKATAVDNPALQATCTVTVTVSDSPSMVSIPAGTFFNGTGNMTLSNFQMSKYDITRSQFVAVLGTDPSDQAVSTGLGDPVQNVTWYQAIAYCNKLSLLENKTPVYSVTGVDFRTLAFSGIPTTANTSWDNAVTDLSANGFRLPTEAEWSWAAMGGMSDSVASNLVGGVNHGGINKPFAGSSGSNLIGDYAWYSGNAGTTSKPVGTKLPNELGLFDMTGNLWQWCGDWSSSYPGGARTNYTGPTSGTSRVTRGGSWYNLGSNAAISYRSNNLVPHVALNTVGFRVVKNSPPDTAPSGLTPLAGLGQVSLSWNPVTGAASYQVHWAPGSAASISDTAVPASGTSSTVSGLTNGLQYAFIVTAINYAGEGLASAVVTSTPQAVELALVPGGSFSNWGPEITVSAFNIGKYEITQAQYKSVMGTNPAIGYGIGNGYPAYDMSWYNALVFCNKLSLMEGKTPIYSIGGSTNPADWGPVPTSTTAAWDSATMNRGANGYRLPTEAEWEYAARGGSPVDNYTYAGSNTADTVAWYSANSGNTTHPVGTKASNRLGLYDMTGNVLEWCWDPSASLPSTAQTNYTGASGGTNRIVRGGDSLAANPLLSSRTANYAYNYYYNVGFRVVTNSPLHDTATGLAAVPGNSLVSLTWNAVPGVTNYNIYYSVGSVTLADNVANVNGTTADVVGLQNNTPYTFLVTPVNYTGEGNPSEVVASTTDGSIGTKWTARSLPTSATWNSVAYGNGSFVAVAGASNLAAVSVDGANWTTSNLPSTDAWSSVTYGNGVFLAVASSSQHAATSPDGITWTAQTLPSIGDWSSVIFGKGLFVVPSGNTSTFATSPDGSTWTQRSWSAATGSAMTYGNGLFVTVYFSSNSVSTSTNGINWVGGKMIPAYAYWNSVVFGNGRYVAVGGISGLLTATSTDATTWTSQSLTGRSRSLSVAYGKGVFVSLGNGSSQVLTSIDGKNWTTSTLPSTGNWTSVAFGKGIFVAVASGSSLAVTSP